MTLAVEEILTAQKFSPSGKIRATSAVFSRAASQTLDIQGVRQLPTSLLLYPFCLNLVFQRFLKII